MQAAEAALYHGLSALIHDGKNKEEESMKVCLQAAASAVRLLHTTCTSQPLPRKVWDKLVSSSSKNNAAVLPLLLGAAFHPESSSQLKQEARQLLKMALFDQAHIASLSQYVVASLPPSNKETPSAVGIDAGVANTYASQLFQVLEEGFSLLFSSSSNAESEKKKEISKRWSYLSANDTTNKDQTQQQAKEIMASCLHWLICQYSSALSEYLAIQQKQQQKEQEGTSSLYSNKHDNVANTAAMSRLKSSDFGFFWTLIKLVEIQYSHDNDIDIDSVANNDVILWQAYAAMAACIPKCRLYRPTEDAAGGGVYLTALTTLVNKAVLSSCNTVTILPYILSTIKDVAAVEHRAVQDHLPSLWPMMWHLAGTDTITDGTRVELACCMLNAYAELRQLEALLDTLVAAIVHHHHDVGTTATATSSPMPGHIASIIFHPRFQSTLMHCLGNVPSGQIALFIQWAARQIPSMIKSDSSGSGSDPKICLVVGMIGELVGMCIDALQPQIMIATSIAEAVAQVLVPAIKIELRPLLLLLSSGMTCSEKTGKKRSEIDQESVVRSPLSFASQQQQYQLAALMYIYTASVGIYGKCVALHPQIVPLPGHNYHHYISTTRLDQYGFFDPLKEEGGEEGSEERQFVELADLIVNTLDNNNGDDDNNSGKYAVVWSALHAACYWMTVLHNKHIYFTHSSYHIKPTTAVGGGDGDWELKSKRRSTKQLEEQLGKLADALVHIHTGGDGYEKKRIVVVKNKREEREGEGRQHMVDVQSDEDIAALAFNLVMMKFASASASSCDNLTDLVVNWASYDCLLKLVKQCLLQGKASMGALSWMIERKRARELIIPAISQCLFLRLVDNVTAFEGEGDDDQHHSKKKKKKSKKSVDDERKAWSPLAEILKQMAIIKPGDALAQDTMHAWSQHLKRLLKQTHTPQYSNNNYNNKNDSTMNALLHNVASLPLLHIDEAQAVCLAGISSSLLLLLPTHSSSTADGGNHILAIIAQCLQCMHTQLASDGIWGDVLYQYASSLPGNAELEIERKVLLRECTVKHAAALAFMNTTKDSGCTIGNISTTFDGEITEVSSSNQGLPVFMMEAYLAGIAHNIVNTSGDETTPPPPLSTSMVKFLKKGEKKVLMVLRSQQDIYTTSSNNEKYPSDDGAATTALVTTCFASMAHLINIALQHHTTGDDKSIIIGSKVFEAVPQQLAWLAALAIPDNTNSNHKSSKVMVTSVEVGLFIRACCTFTTRLSPSPPFSHIASLTALILSLQAASLPENPSGGSVASGISSLKLQPPVRRILPRTAVFPSLTDASTASGSTSMREELLGGLLQLIRGLNPDDQLEPLLLFLEHSLPLNLAMNDHYSLCLPMAELGLALVEGPSSGRALQVLARHVDRLTASLSDFCSKILFGSNNSDCVSSGHVSVYKLAQSIFIMRTGKFTHQAGDFKNIPTAHLKQQHNVKMLALTTSLRTLESLIARPKIFKCTPRHINHILHTILSIWENTDTHNSGGGVGGIYTEEKGSRLLYTKQLTAEMYCGSCLLLAAVLRHRPTEVSRALPLVNLVIQSLLTSLVNFLPESLPNTNDLVVVAVKCAELLATVMSAVAVEMKDVSHKYCSHLLAQYIILIASPPTNTSRSALHTTSGSGSGRGQGGGGGGGGEVNGLVLKAVRQGAYALYDACSPGEVQYLYALLGQQGGRQGGLWRKGLSELKEGYEREYRYRGKV